MLDAKSLNAQAGIVGSGRSLFVASVFFMNIGLIRAMSVESFGSFQQVFMFSALFMVFALGIPESMYFFLPRLTVEERSRFLGQTIVILAVAGFFIALLFFFGASFFAEIQKNSDIEQSIRVFGIYGAFLIASSFSDPVFIIFKRLRYLFILSAIHALFFVALTVWYYVTKCSLTALFTAMAVFACVRYLIAIIFFGRLRRSIGEISLFRGKSMLLLQVSFAMPIALSTTIDIISRWLDKFVVSILFGTESLGMFYVGAIEIPFIGIVISSVYSVVSPVLNSLHHKNDSQGFILLVNKTLTITSKIIWPVFAYFIVFAGNIIPFVCKEDFLESVLPFRIYLILVPIRIASYGVIVLALGRPRAVFWSAFAALGINFILSVYLALNIGFIGPAVATVISTYFHVLLLIVIILKELRTGIMQLVPVAFFLKVAVVCLAATAAAYGLKVLFSLQDDFTTLVWTFPCFTGVYLFLASKTGFIRFSEIKAAVGEIAHGKKV